MTALNKKTIETNSAETPVHQLQSLFDADMKAVNEHIVTHMQSDVPLIPELANYLIAAGGKRLRPLLVLAATSLFDGEMQRAHQLAAAVEFIHTATLLHDDVVDHSEKRRGKESANVTFGNEASVLVGDFLFSRAFQLMVADGSLETLRILSDASAIIAEGEVKQLSIQNDLSASIEDYLSVIEGKTASLFAAACEVGPVIANASEHQETMRQYGYNLGMAFQISDDILDYDPERSQLGKKIGDDFAEGKVTAPIIFAYQNSNDEEKEFWARTIAEKDQTETDFEQALSLIQKHDAMAKSRELARKYCDLAESNLQAIKASDVKNILSDLPQFILNRQK